MKHTEITYTYKKHFKHDNHRKSRLIKINPILEKLHVDNTMKHISKILYDIDIRNDL